MTEANEMAKKIKEAHTHNQRDIDEIEEERMMQDIDKETFAFNLYNQLLDEFGAIDPNGNLARQIQEATGSTLDNIIRYLQATILSEMQAKIPTSFPR